MHTCVCVNNKNTHHLKKEFMNAKLQSFAIAVAAAGVGAFIAIAIKAHMDKASTTSLVATK